MDVEIEDLIVITGGPGSGKTTLVEALSEAGWRTSEEVGRRIIRQQQAISGRALPWVDPALFAELMLSAEIDNYDAAVGTAGVTFFDRGVPDVLGYLRLSGLPVPHHALQAARLYRYGPRVLIAPPWPEIFGQDSERRQTLEEAERTYAAMVAAYRACGYALVEIPRAPVEERVRFVLSSGLVPAP